MARNVDTRCACVFVGHGELPSLGFSIIFQEFYIYAISKASTHNAVVRLVFAGDVNSMFQEASKRGSMQGFGGALFLSDSDILNYTPPLTAMAWLRHRLSHDLEATQKINLSLHLSLS